LLADPESYEIVTYESADKAPPSYARQLAEEWAFNY
jgi:UDP-3-O-[3-hydroxymyristoyl] N-acetylglucosamine deacetylase